MTSRARPSLPWQVRAYARLLATSLFAAGVALCAVPAAPASAAPAALQPGRDYHSYANVDAFVTRHLDLALDVDFDARRLSGVVDLTVRRLDPTATKLVLDTRALSIRAAWLVASDRQLTPLAYSLGATDSALGTPLSIEVPSAAGSGEGGEFTVRVSYQTSPDATALQWLTPAQTAGKRHPFLFTQSQAIHARSWIPLQDTPQVRVTYSAEIHTPRELRAVMSASNDPAAPLAGVFRFGMPQPIPSYLIALGVGELEFRPTGPRTGVYAEPAQVELAASEFADTEAMIVATERLFGPYQWGRFDLLVLPPSFPYGGMENPRLTFATPTILAGDRSLVALVAHELAHSWSGNLVTNATWRDFWINEGFTVFLEARIMEAVYGRDRERQEAVLGKQDLDDELPSVKPEFQRLVIDLRDYDPDDAFSNVPYEKGRLFLVWIESRVGREPFDAWLRGWFERHAFTSVTTATFEADLQQHLLAQHPGKVSAAELDRWLRGPGLPADAVLAESPAFRNVDAIRSEWLAGRLPTAALGRDGWSVAQWQYFLDNLPVLTPAQLESLDRQHRLTASTNAEIAFSWFRNAIRGSYRPAYPALERYLLSIGRRKLIAPLYTELMATPANAAFARDVYARARPGYHSIAQVTLDRIVTTP